MGSKCGIIEAIHPGRGFLLDFRTYMGLKNYIAETKVEMKHVTWPTRKQAIAFTLIVIVISIGVAFFLGFFDYLFVSVLKKFF
jgi:preprotein translocase SecE subunit